MKQFIYICISFVFSLTFGQEISLYFNPTVKNDSLKVELLIEGDNSVELGSSNFVYNIEGDAVNLETPSAKLPTYSYTSYSFWDYSRNKNFEHVLLSRVHKPESLLKIQKVSLGEVSYPILDKCKNVELKWDHKKGDIRSHKKSIKKNIFFKDTIVSLVDQILSTEVLEDESQELLSIIEPSSHSIKWFKDEEKVGEGKSINTSKTGVYYATISNGCETKTTQSYRIDKITDIVVQKSLLSSSLYPNPVIDEMTLRVDKSKIGDIQRVTLINELGQELKDLTINVKQSFTKFNIVNWNLPEGVYFVKVFYKEDTEILRFVY